MFKSIIALLGSTLLSSFFTFVTQLLIARNVSPAEYGVVMSSLTLVALVVPLVGTGLEGYLLKFHAQNRGFDRSFNKVAAQFVVISIPVSCVLFILIGSDIGHWFYLLVLSQFLVNLSISIYQAEQRYGAVSLILLIQSLTRLILLFLCLVFIGLYVKTVYFIYVISSFLIILICTLLIIRGTNSAKYTNSAKKYTLIFVAKNSFPFGIGVFLHLIYFQSAILLLNKFGMSQGSGFYAAAFSLLTLAYLFPGVIFQRYLLPKVHQLTEQENDKGITDVFRKGFNLMLVSGLTVSLCFYALASIVIPLIFGNDYYQSIWILEALSICVLLRYLSSSAGVYLVSGELIRVKNKYMFFCALLNLSLNVIFIPLYGVIAAVLVSILSEVMLMMLLFRGLFKYKFIGINLKSIFLRS